MTKSETLTAIENYDSLIDTQTWAFIDKTASFSSGSSSDPSIAEQRRIYNAMCASFDAPYPSDVSSEDISLNQVPIRHYKKNSKTQTACTLVYFHGGGFVLGGLESHDSICADLCDQTELDLISVDYRLAPEHKHPAAFQDALAVTKSIAEMSGPVILCGDSAGGNLAAAVTHALRNSDTNVRGQVLIYPTLAAELTSRSAIRHAQAPLFASRDMEAFQRIRAVSDVPIDDFSFAPLSDTDFSDLPPTVIFCAECDPLCDEGELYKEAIDNAGGKVHLCIEEGLVHGYLRARHSVDRAADSFQRIVSAIKSLIPASIKKKLPTSSHNLQPSPQ